MNEIMWLKLVQTYCLPRLLYSCQIWPREVAYRLNTIYNTRPKSTEKDAIWTYFQHIVHFSHFSLLRFMVSNVCVLYSVCCPRGVINDKITEMCLNCIYVLYTQKVNNLDKLHPETQTS